LERAKYVVITGSIGCGKSSVCDILEAKGYEIIDADNIARIVAQEEIEQIRSVFGNHFIKNGMLDREAIAKLIFKDRDAKVKLEAIMHPKIKEKIFAQMEKLEKKGKIYFIDIPLFFESDNYRQLSPVAVVYASKDMQLSRIMKRSGLDQEGADSRISAQIDIDKKKELADFIIDNSGEKSILEEKVNIFLEEVKQWFYKNTAQAETIF
jgi:dephospho-CoA kinase